MKKIIQCRNCDGTGKEEVSICDICKQEDPAGQMVKSKEYICQSCYFKTLSDEEIAEL
jgi:RecJ-like exonuclease